MNEAPDTAAAWAVRRIRAAMLKTLPVMAEASCARSEFPDLWFPERPSKRQETDAKAICGACAERVKCLAFALRTHKQPGIWGGTTEQERMLLVESVRHRMAHLEEEPA